MNKLVIVLCLVCSLVCSSCATKMLWEATDPNEYVRIKYTDISEEELQAKGCKYYKNDEKLSYYVNKNSFQKFKDYTYRAFATPVTIVVDAASVVILVVGIIAKDNFVEEHKVDPDADPYGPASKKI